MEEPQGQHTCKHQTAGMLRCAVPSCPDAPGKRYRVKASGIPMEGKLVDGHVTLERVLTDEGWKWREA